MAKNAYDTVTNNIKKLKSLGIKLLLKNVLTNTNKTHFDKIEQAVNTLNCNFKVEKREKSSLYCLTRTNMQKYFEKLNR